jgi:hypothetical protein
MCFWRQFLRKMEQGHPVAAYLSRYIVPWVMCFWRQFLRKMWPIQLAFVSCKANARV